MSTYYRPTKPIKLRHIKENLDLQEIGFEVIDDLKTTIIIFFTRVITFIMQPTLKDLLLMLSVMVATTQIKFYPFWRKNTKRIGSPSMRTNMIIMKVQKHPFLIFFYHELVNHNNSVNSLWDSYNIFRWWRQEEIIHYD